MGAKYRCNNRVSAIGWGQFTFPDREPIYLWSRNGSSNGREVDRTELAFRPVESSPTLDGNAALPPWSRSIRVATADGVTVHIRATPSIMGHSAYATSRPPKSTVTSYRMQNLSTPAASMAIHRPLVKMRIDNQSHRCGFRCFMAQKQVRWAFISVVGDL